MSKTEVKKIIKKYANELRKKNFSVSSMYLFGSYAKGKAHKWSDIDVAVVSNNLKNSLGRDYKKMLYTTLDVDTRLEPHGFTMKEFMDNSNPMSYEIRKTGIRVV